jgi:beta-1,4-mannosyltransferase
MTQQPIRVVMLPGRSLENSNPFVSLLCSSLEDHGVELLADRWDIVRHGECDIVHVHWPENLAVGASFRSSMKKTARMLASLVSGRRRGVEVVWTVHNAAPHSNSSRLLTKFIYAVTSRQTDLAIFLSESARQTVIARNKRLAHVPQVVVPHGHYRDSYDVSGLSALEARAALGLPAAGTLHLVMGQIRANKNIVEYARAFVETASSASTLVIAGWPKDPETVKQLRALAEVHERVVLRAEPVPEQQITTYLRAADVAVLPYGIPSSGALVLALSFDTPVVTIDTPAVREISETANLAQWITTSTGEPPLLVQLAESVKRPSAGPDLAEFDWKRIGAATAGAYESLLQRRKQPERV